MVTRCRRCEVADLDDTLKTVRRATHETIGKVSDDISRRYKFNTAIAAIMELVNHLGRLDGDQPQARAVRQEGLSVVVQLLAPIVPHAAAVLWQALGHNNELVDAAWPQVDQSALERDSIPLVVQVNGRKRAVIDVAPDAAKADCERQALADDNVRRFTDNKTIRKVIVVPGKLVNIVVAD